MAWTNLREDLDELFGEITTHVEQMGGALDARKAWLLAYWRHRETLRPERGRARGEALRGGPGKTRKLDALKRRQLRAEPRSRSSAELALQYGVTPGAVNYHRRKTIRG